MKKPIRTPKHSLEVLESRIAPAAVPLTAQWLQATHSVDGSPIQLHGGQGLSTGGQNSGSYLLYIEQGNAWVFTTDFNNNKLVDFNEITGIAAGKNLRMISFVDIHGDIATNLKETQTSGGVVLALSDSNDNSADDGLTVRGDGRVILNSRIEKIELRSLTTADIVDQDGNGVVNDVDLDLRWAPTTYSIFGNVYAGGGFGVPGDATSGLLLDSSALRNFGHENTTHPMIGSIRVGTAVSGSYFSFGINGGWEANAGVLQQRIRAGIVLGDDSQGYIVPFVPSPGQPGASIAFVRAAQAGMEFNLNGLYAGNGGAGAPGGDVTDVTLNGDDAGGYDIIAGNGGDGTKGGNGGSVLRFSDFSSDTSKVVIRSGSGGNGSTGAGGNGGTSDIQNANFYGDFTIAMGNGGNGFTQGGNGASLTKAIFTQPGPELANGGIAWGTSHSPSYYNPNPAAVDDPATPENEQSPFLASIGTQQGIDIDGDGFGDFVFSTLPMSQLVVMFGDPLSGFRTIISPEGLALNDRLYLASPRNAEAVTVADLNGDGRPDIAAGSSDQGSLAGVMVYIANWSDVNKDGDVIDPEDQFVGFYEPRFSPLPLLETGDPETDNSTLPFWKGPQAITGLVAGDFDGDGANELAVLATYYDDVPKPEVNGVTIALNRANSVLVFLTPDRELDTNTGEYFLTGHFYADFGSKRVETSSATAPAVPRLPFITIDLGFGRFLLEATALAGDATHDVVLVGEQGEIRAAISTIEYFVRDPLLFVTPPEVIGGWNLAEVDTNRRPFVSAQEPNISPAAVALRDYAVVDLDQDGNADVIALSDSPANFVVGMLGDGTGVGLQDSGDDDGGVNNQTSDQAGFPVEGDARGIKAIDATAEGIVDDFTILRQQGPSYNVSLFDYRSGPTTAASGPVGAGTLLTVVNANISQYRTAQVTDAAMWDVYYQNVGDFANPGTGVSNPEGRITDETLYFLSAGPLFSFQLFQVQREPGLAIFAGDGGNSFVGRAGNGGVVGGKGKIETIVIDPTNNITTTDLVGAVQIAFDGFVQLHGGTGGLGFSRGGNGGAVTGVTVRDSNAIPYIAPGAIMVAGDGGRGISGNGGAGGDLAGNSILNGSLFIAGDGGAGKIGGRGGSVIGNQQNIGTARIYDTNVNTVEVYGGIGGAGIRGGGAGGNITNFFPIIEGDIGIVLSGGSLSYVAGRGGNSVSGTGGGGGSVVNSSPDLNAILEHQVWVEGGAGGNGTSGGAGGAVTNFLLTNTGAPPRVYAFLGGNGGTGTTGSGGRGGNVTGVDAKSLGSLGGLNFLFPSPLYPNIPVPSFFGYSRIISGNGGESFGGKGGDGGTVSNIKTGITDGTLAVVAGAGGDGLSQGGLGGSVLNLFMAGLGSATTSKALVIAGAGGDARAYIPNPLDPSPDQAQKAFGGRVGKGGNGGSINGVSQPGGSPGHYDLIGGNGGSTVHYGTIRDSKTFVGRGGSVTNVNVAASIGNIDAAVPIKSYNDILNGESIADFVERRMRIGQNLVESLSDVDGNVGIVVGSAGRNKAVAADPLGAPYEFRSQPSPNAKNGDLLNIRVNTLMSAVAGSVDRLAAIQLASNINIASGSLVGTDKDPVGSIDYLDENGDPVTKIPISPVRDGRLVDGAVIAIKYGAHNMQGRIFSF